MKKIFTLIFALTVSISYGQFKDSGSSPDIKSGILNKGGDSESILGFFNPDNFSMHHTFDLSYSTFGSNGLALGVYTNSMMYKFSDRLNLQTDISVVNSPYNSLGKDFSKQINGVYLSRAQLNFKATDNMNIMVEYDHNPMGYYSPFYYGGYSPFYRGGFYNQFGFGN